MAVTSPARALAPIPALDGLRAVAVTLVVLFHAGRLSGGFLGVDLFFVLSGFLITTLLLDEHARTGTIALGAFWLRRVRRLVPALALLLLLVLLAVAVLYDLESVGANRNEAIASALYVSNWWSIYEPAPYLTILQHTWSLAIEAQFYLVWPIVLLVALRGRRDPRQAATVTLAIAATGAVAGAVLMAVLYDGGAGLARAYFGTDTRAPAILFGAVLAAQARRARSELSPISTRAVDVGACILFVVFLGLAALVARDDHTLYEGAYAVVVGPLLTTIVAAAALTKGMLARLLALPPVRALGLISYGVYLWHWPVMYLCNPGRVHLSPWPLLGLQCAITVAIATASYVFVELPIRQRRRPFTRAPEPARA